MIGSIASLQFDVTATFVEGVESLNGQVGRFFLPTTLEWNISTDAGEMPVGADATFDLLLSSDHGANWRSAFPPGGCLTVAAGGARYGTVTELAEGLEARAGDWAKLVCLTAGGSIPGKGLQAILYGDEV